MKPMPQPPPVEVEDGRTYIGEQMHSGGLMRVVQNLTTLVFHGWLVLLPEQLHQRSLVCHVIDL